MEQQNQLEEIKALRDQLQNAVKDRDFYKEKTRQLLDEVQRIFVEMGVNLEQETLRRKERTDKLVQIIKQQKEELGIIT